MRPNSRAYSIQIFLLALLSLAPCYAQQTDLGPIVQLPEYIRYQRPTAEAEKAAADQLRKLLGSGEVKMPITLAGPFLNQWLDLDGLPGSVPSSYIIPRVEGFLRGSGVAVKEPEGLKMLREKLKADEEGELIMRRPTLSEYEYLWAIAPGDLQGPILVTELQGHAVLWNFFSEGVVLMEDVSEAKDSLQDAYKAFANLPQTALETEPMPDFVSRIVNGGEVPDMLKKATTSTSPIIVFLTSEQAVEARVSTPDLLAYVRGLKDALAQAVVANHSERIYMEFDLVSGKEPSYYVGAQPALSAEATADLLTQLRAVTPPPTKGPVRMFFLELPADASVDKPEDGSESPAKDPSPSPSENSKPDSQD